MANTNVTEFFQTMPEDKTLKQQFKTDPDIQACFNVALQAGYTITAAELHAGLNQLSKEQLAEVVNPGVAPRVYESCPSA